ncbi:MAG: porin [Chromatiales bacterium]|nr:porin [Chromatiales bacterium]
MKKNLLALGVSMALAGATQQAMAIDNIRINGFLTAAATYADADSAYNIDLASDDVRFDGRDNRLGLQIGADVNERMSFTLQLLARAVPDNYNAEADWAFVGYQLTDDVQVRAGKVKFPTFLVSDYLEVGYAYPWIRPPQEVYSLNPITSLSGLDVLWYVPIGDNNLLIQPYFGNSSGTGFVTGMQGPVINTLDPTVNVGTEVDFEAKKLGGINVALSTAIGTFRAGYLTTEVSSDFAGGLIDEDKASFASVGMNIDWNNFVGYAEWASRDQDDGAEFGFPDQEAWYVTAGYRFGAWLPSLTYASLAGGDPDDANVELFDQEQTSVTLGLRYELAAGAALKFEATRVDVEDAATDYGLFDGPLSEDSANIYSVALDVIF